jgi:uncharacterized membrane protein
MRRALVGQASAKKETPLETTKPDIIMIKRILLLAAVIGFIAQSSVFAADPTPAPSPAKETITENASPSPSPEKKTRRRTRVEARRKARETRREARKEPKSSPTPEKAEATPTPKQ